MRFRLTALAIHLALSAAVLGIILGGLFLGWYHWPGWYLADVKQVVLVMVGVDVVVGPLLTSVVASPGKARRVLTRDLAVIAAVQLCALGYGTWSLWCGRPLYYAFSENVLQLVQAYDIEPGEIALAHQQHRDQWVPHWYNLPRWIWAPLPKDAEEQGKIVASAISGGGDVIGMPRYYQPWSAGRAALRDQLKTPDEVAYFFLKDKVRLKTRMQAAGLPTNQANAIPLTGRGQPLLAVFDPTSLTLLGIFDGK